MIEQRKAGLEKSRADLEEAKADLWEKGREADRAERLVAKKMLPQEDFEKASSAQKMATARVASLEAQIKMMQANLKEMEYTRKYQMHLMAPFDGTVVEKQGEVGEVINPMAMSSSLGRSAVVTIADLEAHGRRDRHLREPDVADRAGSARRGLRQREPEQALSGPAAPDHPHGRPDPGDGEGEGRDPRSRRQALSRAGGHRSLPALQDRCRRPETSKSYLFVPKAAVFQENGHDYVWVVGKKSQVKKRQVEVATTKEDLARVESGLSAGETVVLNPPKVVQGQ